MTDQERFGYLQLKPLGGQSGAAQHVGDFGRQIGIAEAAGGQVDRDPMRHRPGRRRGAGGLQHPGIEFRDQS